MSSPKPGKRRLGREAAIQFLYCQEINPDPRPEALEEFWALRPLKAQAQAFAEQLIAGGMAHAEEIDAILTEKLENYQLDRLAAVDRNILRLAIHEILHCQDIPDAVSINEAIEIAKRYGTTDSASFVNGLLDSIRKANVAS
ncbi:MAG: N utilization substance protein B [Verrucomicrobiales bacterium]|jgi:N utilization substance protein B